MATFVAQFCFGCKYTDCVVVCPMECFHVREQMLYINPEECIDSGACTPECPVDAIFLDEKASPQWRDFIALNAEMAPLNPRHL